MVRLRDMPGFKAVMGYRYIDDIVLEQERQRQRVHRAPEREHPPRMRRKQPRRRAAVF